MRLNHTMTFAATALLLSMIPAVSVEPAFAGADAGWTVAPPVPAPAGATDSVLRDVSVLSPSSVWAVGGWWAGKTHPLAVHWDGTAWTELPVPDTLPPSENYHLAAVDAVTSAEVWAVGSIESQATGPLIPSALALHYDGTTWTPVPTNAGRVASQSSLADVDMHTATDGWAVGQQVVDGVQAQPLILRWTVDHFTPVSVPKIGSAARLTSVFAGGVDDAGPLVASRTRLVARRRWYCTGTASDGLGRPYPPAALVTKPCRAWPGAGLARYGPPDRRVRRTARTGARRVSCTSPEARGRPSPRRWPPRRTRWCRSHPPTCGSSGRRRPIRTTLSTGTAYGSPPTAVSRPPPVMASPPRRWHLPPPPATGPRVRCGPSAGLATHLTAYLT
ncbi:hypothetical protein NKG94_00015 [Micromonospora sp. M12]